MALTINRFSHLDSPNDDSDDECNSELTIAEGTISPVLHKKERRSDKSAPTGQSTMHSESDWPPLQSSCKSPAKDQEMTSPQRQSTMRSDQDPKLADHLRLLRKQFQNAPNGQTTMYSANCQTSRKRKAEVLKEDNNIIYISFAKVKVPSRMQFTKTIRNMTKVQYPGQTRDLKSGLGYSIKPETPEIAESFTQSKLEELFPDTQVEIGGRKNKTNNKKKQSYSFVISRVSEQLDEDDIQSELETINNIKVTKIFRIQSRSQNKPTMLIRVFTDDGPACKKAIDNGVYICNELKRCEASKTEPKVTMCYKCQGFGHMASNCPNQQRCLRCGEDHSVKDCKVQKQQIKCINCHGDHPAQYKGCPAYRNAQVEAQKTQPKISSYAQAVNSNSKPAEVQPSMTKSEIEDFIKETVKNTVADQVEAAVQKAMDEKIAAVITETVKQASSQIKETVEAQINKAMETQFSKIDFSELITSNIKAKQESRSSKDTGRHNNSRKPTNNSR